MSFHFFPSRDIDEDLIDVPTGYRRRVNWLPQIGDTFPRFFVSTTHGNFDFWDWADGHWSFLFSHPAANTSICTTEVGALAKYQDEFDALGVKILGLSGSSLDEQRDWHRDIEELYQTKIEFPFATDVNGRLSEIFGMRHAKECSTAPIRKSFILDPQMRIRMIFEYPLAIGRSVEEILRVFEALQLHDETGFSTPAEWFAGDPVVVQPEHAEADLVARFGHGSQNLLPYLRVMTPGNAR